MSFGIPADLRGMVMYWWKIIDQPQILLDNLYTFIAFDMYLASLEKTKQVVKEAASKGFIIIEPLLETVSLSPELRAEFELWQTQGQEKVKRMEDTLNKKWRESIAIGDAMVVDILFSDLIDVAVREKAGKLPASSIKLQQQDFSKGIQGYSVESDPQGQEIQYPFLIDSKARTISHNCPEYLGLRQKQKRFCIHLARAFIKLFVSDPVNSKQTLRDLVDNRDAWRFE